MRQPYVVMSPATSAPLSDESADERNADECLRYDSLFTGLPLLNHDVSPRPPHKLHVHGSSQVVDRLHLKVRAEAH